MAEETSFLEPPSDFTFSEAALAREWGVTVRELAQSRNAFLREGLHFVYRKFQISYSALGIAEARRHLGPSPVKEGSSPPKLGAAVRVLGQGAPLGDGVVEVFRLPSNPRLLICKDEHGDSLTLRVRMNSAFRRGMRVDLRAQCRWVPTDPACQVAGYYTFTAKPPRFPGRW